MKLLLMTCIMVLLAACAVQPSQPVPETDRGIRVFGRQYRPWDVLYLPSDGRGFVVAVLHGQNALGLWSLERSIEVELYPQVGYHPDGLAPWRDKCFVVAAEGEREVQLWCLDSDSLVNEKKLEVNFPVRNVLVSDLDGDGNLDLVLAPYSGGKITVLWGEGGFRFSRPQHLTAAPTPWYPTVIDWNHDDLPDLVWSDWDTGSVRVQVNLGRRRFRTVLLQPPGPGSPRQVGVGDVDGDGWDDVVAALETGKAARVFYHRHGRKVETEDIPAPEWGYSSAAVMADGTVILGEEGRVILARRHDNNWELRQLPAGSLPERLRLADVNRDGQADLLVANSAGGGVTLIYGPLWQRAKPLMTDKP